MRLIFAIALSALAAEDPWDLKRNSRTPPDVEVLSTDTGDGVRVEEIYYTGEMVAGKPVRVYGFLARPEAAAGKLPGVLTLHGGGGTASKDAAIRLAREANAYVLNVDWSSDPKRAQRVTVASALGDLKLFGDPRHVKEDLSDFTARHVLRALSKGIDVLRAQKGVDSGKIAVFGGSWGGFLSLLLAGLDERARCVVSGYGAGGFRDTYSYCSRQVYLQGEQRAEFWLRTVDPILYARRIKGPVALLTATNELHFWLNSAAATYARLPRGSRIIISPNTVHATGSGVVWPNVDWLQSCFGDAPAWPAVTNFNFDGKQASWRASAEGTLSRGDFYFSPGRERWPGRAWVRIPAVDRNGTYAAELPQWLAGVEGDGYPLITDGRKRSASAPPLHVPGLSLQAMSARRSEPGLIDDFSTDTGLWRLLLDNAQKAKLAWRPAGAGGPGGIVITESRERDEEVAVETNAITFARAYVKPENSLRFLIDTQGTEARLTVELFEDAGLKTERVLSASVSALPAKGLQEVRVPLASFTAKGGPPRWAFVDKLNLRLPMPARAAWTLEAVGII